MMEFIEKSRASLTRNIFQRDFYVKKLAQYAKMDTIIVVQGQRRVGKSHVIIAYLQSLIISKEKIFYLNKELDEKETIKESADLSACFQEFEKQFGTPEYIVIDEIQDIIGWEKFIRAKYAEKRFTIIISGSNSHLLSGELATYLTGRYLDFFVYPFDFKEFMEYRGEGDKKKLFLEYARYGGLPEIVILDNEELKANYLKTTFQALLLKDIVKRYAVQEITVLEKIIAFLANTIGSLVSIRNIHHFLVSTGNKTLSLSTVSNYVKYFHTTFILEEAKRYDLKGKKIMEQVQKHYFTDIGMRNSLGFSFAQDVGKIMENIVYMHYKKYGYEVFVGASARKEIDFVVRKGGITKYVQVAYTISDSATREREFGNLLNIKDNWEKIVISMDDLASGLVDGVKWVNLLDVLANDEI